MPRTMRLAAVLTALSLLVALGGCLFNGEDDHETPPTEPPAWVEPTTGDMLMTYFRDYYAGCDLEHLGLILHDGFRFIAQDGTEYDRDQALTIHGLICDGAAGDGGIAFESIWVEFLNPLGIWADVPDTDPSFGSVAGALHRPYNVFISFKVDGQALIFQAIGEAVFYAVPVDGVYELLGVVDATNGNKATEAHSWSSIWALFD
ncbi:MAG: hypothetical protein R3D98_17930 [Candidatus Krumholzibacteriia bacterium]